MSAGKKSHGKHSKEAVDQRACENKAAAQEGETEPEGATEALPNDGVEASTPEPDLSSQATQAISLQGADAAETAVIPAVPDNAVYSLAQASLAEGDASGVAMPEERKSHKKLLIALGIVLAVLVAVYAAGTVFFMGHFYPNTTMGGVDVSLKDASQAAAIVDPVVEGYGITVSGQGLNFTVGSDEMGLNADIDEAAANALDVNAAFAWPVQVFGQHDVSRYMTESFDTSTLTSLVEQKVQEFNTTATEPQNATIAYSETEQSFVIQPEQLGTKLDVDVVLDDVLEAVDGLKTTLTLESDDLARPAIMQDDERFQTAISQANAYLGADLTLMMGDTGVQAAEINAVQIAQWVVLDEELNVSFDDAAMTEWVNQLVAGLDTVGTTRTYTRPDGATFTVSGGLYGWQVDSDSLGEQIIEGIKNGTVATITVPTIVEGVSYNGAGTQDWGAYVDVDLTEQHARYYDAAGNLLWEADVVTGAPDGKHNTPEGAWIIYKKQSPATLTGDILASTGAPEYQTKVSFWMPFTYSGCGLHDATWQSAFGGTRYRNGYGSHGCVNLSYSAAQELYNLVSVGDAVIVHS